MTIRLGRSWSNSVRSFNIPSDTAPYGMVQMISAQNPLVCKIGGSLFDWPELFPRLAALLASESRRVLLIAGGGAAADLVRDWDRRHCLGAERAHRLAIRSMRLGEALLADRLPEAAVVADIQEATRAWKNGSLPILNVEAWLAREAAENRPALPPSWDVTSDSIAARVARRWNADLLLVKSTSPERANGQFVDRRFAEFARDLPVEWCDLRSGERGELLMRHGHANTPRFL